jgi:hypothetical protein
MLYAANRKESGNLPSMQDFWPLDTDELDKKGMSDEQKVAHLKDLMKQAKEMTSTWK